MNKFPRPNDPQFVYRIAEIHPRFKILIKRYKSVYDPGHYQYIAHALRHNTIPELIYKLRNELSPTGIYNLKQTPRWGIQKTTLLVLYTYLSSLYMYNRKRVYNTTLDYEIGFRDINPNGNQYLQLMKDVYSANRDEKLYPYCNLLKKTAELPLSSRVLKYHAEYIFTYYERPLCKLIYDINIIQNTKFKSDYILYFLNHGTIETKQMMMVYISVMKQSRYLYRETPLPPISLLPPPVIIPPERISKKRKRRSITRDREMDLLTQMVEDKLHPYGSRSSFISYSGIEDTTNKLLRERALQLGTFMPTRNKSFVRPSLPPEKKVKRTIIRVDKNFRELGREEIIIPKSKWKYKDKEMVRQEFPGKFLQTNKPGESIEDYLSKFMKLTPEKKNIRRLGNTYFCNYQGCTEGPWNSEKEAKRHYRDVHDNEMFISDTETVIDNESVSGGETVVDDDEQRNENIMKTLYWTSDSEEENDTVGRGGSDDENISDEIKDLMNSMITGVEKGKTYYCEICGYGPLSKSSISSHYSRKHKGLKTKKSKKFYKKNGRYYCKHPGCTEGPWTVQYNAHNHYIRRHVKLQKKKIRLSYTYTKKNGKYYCKLCNHGPLLSKRGILEHYYKKHKKKQKFVGPQFTTFRNPEFTISDSLPFVMPPPPPVQVIQKGKRKRIDEEDLVQLMINEWHPLKKVKRIYYEKDGKYYCKVCGKGLTTKQGINYHYQSKHESKYEASVRISKMLSHETKLRSILRSIQNKYDKKLKYAYKKGDGYYCKVCNRGPLSKDGITDHYNNVHHIPNPTTKSSEIFYKEGDGYYCNVCNYGPVRLAASIQSHHLYVHRT
jgi:hypothetical protein